MAVAALAAFAAAALLDRPAPVNAYREVDNRTIVVSTVTGPATWTRVTDVTETPTSVVVRVSSLSAPLPGAGDDILELPVLLSAPIDGRTVVDGNGGQAVPRSG